MTLIDVYDMNIFLKFDQKNLLILIRRELIARSEYHTHQTGTKNCFDCTLRRLVLTIISMIRRYSFQFT